MPFKVCKSWHFGHLFILECRIPLRTLVFMPCDIQGISIIDPVTFSSRLICEFLSVRELSLLPPIAVHSGRRFSIIGALYAILSTKLLGNGRK